MGSASVRRFLGSGWKKASCGAGAVLAAALMAPGVEAQGVPANDYPVTIGGAWSGPHDWSDEMMISDSPCPPQEKEISHAALIPKGLHRGKVLMWRNEIEVIDGMCEDGVSTRAWIFDPNNPDFLIRIEQLLDSQIFCGAASWQHTGQLLVAGGLPTQSGGSPRETYRFRPGLLGSVERDAAMLPVINSTPWTQLGDMLIARYYPTLVGLNVHDVSMPDTGGGTPIGGGSTIVLGGPPQITGRRGNEHWELNTPGSLSWSRHIAPPGTPHNLPPGSPPAPERYALKGTPTPDERFQSYPRAFQLSTEQIFVAGDVDTTAADARHPDGVPNAPGSAWAIENPDVFPTPAEPSWELWRVLPNEDRFYGSAVLLHTLQALNRVLVFGGSRQVTQGDPNSAFFVNDRVAEFKPGSDATAPPPNTAWLSKTDMLEKRLYLNSVVLPTGDVLLLGGSSVDHAHSNDPLAPVTWPELYSPGSNTVFDPGSSRQMNRSNLLPTPTGLAATPRVYHSVAMLLPDGRVFLAGGRDGDPMMSPPAKHTGEIFSPPYLFQFPPGVRPSIGSVPGTVNFSPTSGSFNSFNIDVSLTNPANTVDSVVLLRPAAVTHHFDTDQRFIELRVRFTVLNELDPRHRRLTLDAPRETLGPPGYYMLFVVERDSVDPAKRVPSIAEFVKLQ